MSKRIALITGGNRGIGFEICKQLLERDVFVILAARNEEKAKIAIDKLKKLSNQIVYQRLDMEHPDTFGNTKRFIELEFGKLDILINNAGINLEYSSESENEISALNPNYEDILMTFNINTVRTIQLSNTLLPLLHKSDDARIVNIASSMGQLKNMDKGSIGYRLSKTGLNVMTKVFAKELMDTKIKINSVSPGWVKTDMGGKYARLQVEEAVDTIIWVATNGNLKINGKFLKDRKEIEW